MITYLKKITYLNNDFVFIKKCELDVLSQKDAECSKIYTEKIRFIIH